jgi:TetR/AcrR family transcriptional repressor of nem operon
MGRPREFDERFVLDAAERAFYERGYHATALSDVVAATGLHKGSLYGAFGDKHTLFVRVLGRYADRRMELMDADLVDVPPLEGLRAYLTRLAKEAVGGRGCLLANSALELLPGDREVERIVSTAQAGVQQRLADVLTRVWAEGHGEPGRPAPAMARYVYTIVEGLWELGRTTDDVAVLEEIVSATMRSVV